MANKTISILDFGTSKILALMAEEVAGQKLTITSVGMAKYDGDANAAAVFERADQNMYQNKSDLKEGRAVR